MNLDFLKKKHTNKKQLIDILRIIKEYFEIKEDIIKKNSYEFEELNDDGYPNNKDMVISKHYYTRYYDKSRF